MGPKSNEIVSTLNLTTLEKKKCVHTEYMFTVGKVQVGKVRVNNTFIDIVNVVRTQAYKEKFYKNLNRWWSYMQARLFEDIPASCT